MTFSYHLIGNQETTFNRILNSIKHEFPKTVINIEKIYDKEEIIDREIIGPRKVIRRFIELEVSGDYAYDKSLLNRFEDLKHLCERSDYRKVGITGRRLDFIIYITAYVTNNFKDRWISSTNFGQKATSGIIRLITDDLETTRINDETVKFLIWLKTAKQNIIQNTKDLIKKKYSGKKPKNDFERSIVEVMLDARGNTNELIIGEGINQAKNYGLAAFVVWKVNYENKANKKESEHVGKVEHTIKAEITVTNIKLVNTKLGKTCYLHISEDSSGNIIKWFSNAPMSFECNEKYIVNGTVNRHEVFGDKKIKSTVLSNISIVKKL